MPALNVRTCLFFLVLSLLLLLSFSAPQRSSAVTQPATSGAQQVTVDMYVINIGNINQQQGSYSVDMYLSFAWQGNWSIGTDNASAPAVPSHFEFTNGQISSTTLIEADHNISGTGNNYLEYRVKGTFFSPFNYERYPLDKQTLSVQMEDNFYDSSTLVYVPDTHSMLDPGVVIPGWIIQSGSTKLTVNTHDYNSTFGYPNSPSNGQYYYSRAVFSIQISRPVTTSILQLILPTIVLVALAMMMFRINMENFESRISVGVVSIFTAVAFLLSLDSNIPPSGYFTLADEIMVIIFAITLYALSVTVWFHKYDPKNLPKYVRNFNLASFFLVPIVVIDLIVILIVF